MKKIIKLTILIIISLSVFVIYQKTKNSYYTITAIGDQTSLGINSYGIKEFSYIDYYKEELEKTKEKVEVINRDSNRKQSIENIFNNLKNTSSIKKDLYETDILILTLGYNDLLYEMSLEENLSTIKLEKIINTISIQYNDLIKEIRKYYKNKIIVVGYYESNTDDYYKNIGIKKLNEVLKNNKEVIYIDTYNLLRNRNEYFLNPNSYLPNHKAYYRIAEKIIQKTLENKENIWYINYAFELLWQSFVMAEGEINMKKDIHPEIKDCKVTCACGNTFTCKSTKDEINVEICSECHPFYTGKQSRASRAGRVDKFNKKYGFDQKEAAE